jgi:hypothetical protein
VGEEMKGQYVRFLLAPNTRKGIITDVKTEHGQVEYLFHHDPRFDDTTPDFWAFESDIEVCDRPTDAEVATINMLAKRGGG